VSEQVKDKVKEEGHIMLMMSEGKMKKFLLVPGELPRLLGEVGGESSEQEELGEERDYEISGEADEQDEHSYLNGKESPFYQPPVDRGPG
jgi:hypothetical protein